jgi:riboflavin synthase
MFTGLIEEVGTVRRLERSGQGGRLSVAAKVVLQGTRVGDSIAVSGACLTVVAIDSAGFVVDCMPETLSHTTLGQAVPGALVNLERALAVGARLGGHLVLGHVDGIGEVLEVRRRDGAWEVRVSLPQALAGCVAPKGSIAVDGISLTVIGVGTGTFDVGIIPHTLQATTLGALKRGQRLNLEADVLARYVRQALETLLTGTPGAADRERTSAPGPGAVEAGGLSEAFLREQGFA